MHFGNGAATRCRDVAPDGGGARCSDLNTTRFLRRVIEAERPDLIAFTGAALFSPLCDHLAPKIATLDELVSPRSAHLAWLHALGLWAGALDLSSADLDS